MRRHLRAANEKRASLNRGKFKPGPKITDPTLTEYHFSFFDSLEDHETDEEDGFELLVGGSGDSALASDVVDASDDRVDVITPYTTSRCGALVPSSDEERGNPRREDVVPERSRGIIGAMSDMMGEYAGYEHEDEAMYHSDSGAPSPTVSGEDVGQQQRQVLASTVQQVSLNCSDHTSEPERGDLPAVSRMHRYAEGVTIETNQNAYEYDQDESSSEATPGSSDDDSAGLATQPLSAPELMEWIDQNKCWLDLFNEHSLGYAVMDKILNIIDAPCKTWKTIVSHVVEECGLDKKLRVYPTCPGHSCFTSTRGSSEVTACPQCGAAKPTENAKPAGALTYIPLLPRIASMVANEEECRQLYEYRFQYQREEGVLNDYFDSTAFKHICDRFGGEAKLKYDIFISASTDDVQAYKNKGCDVWPLAAILFNLPPQQRTCVKNVLPLLFIPDGKEPKDLQSFLIPLVNELLEIYETDGALLKFHDNVWRKVRIHLVWFTADGPAHSKVAALKGHHGKCHCRFCLVIGVYSSLARGYYSPSRLNSAAGMEVLYDPSSLPERTEASISDTLLKLENAESIAEKESISKESGIKGPSVLCSLPTMAPYACFPIETMHLFYNVQKRLLELHLSGSQDDFAISGVLISRFDDELREWRRTLPAELFSSPRPLSVYHKWKAAEHKQFTLSFYLVLFDGYLLDSYLDGIQHFVELMEICSQTSIAAVQIERAGLHAVEFFKSYESLYMRYEKDRISYSKSVIHLLLHLQKGLKECGPLPYCSQFWVEGYAGWVVDRLNARNLAAQSMTKTAVFGEACKMYFQDHFSHSAEHWDRVNSDSGFDLLGKSTVCPLDDSTEDGSQLLERLIDYFQRKYVDLDEDSARKLVASVPRYKSWPRIRFSCGNGTQTAYVLPEDGRVDGNARRTKRLRSFVAVEMDATEEKADVYYGRLLKLMEFELSPDSSEGCRRELWHRTHTLALFDWSENLISGRQGQIFKTGNIARAFSKPTIEDVSVIRRLVGVVEHTVPRKGSGPGSSRFPHQQGKTRTYFIDNNARIDHLQDSSRVSMDGVNRVLIDLQPAATETGTIAQDEVA